MEATALLTFIKDYGLPLVLLVFIIIWLRPKLDQLWDNSITQGHHDVKFTFERDAEVNSMLYQIMADCDSDWVTLWQFHNGTHNVMGMPMLFISATNQVSSGTNRQWASDYQVVHTALFSDAYNVSEDLIVVQEGDNRLQTATLKLIMSREGIKSMYLVWLTDINSRIIGGLSVSFCTKKELDHQKCKKLMEYSVRLSTLLERMQREYNQKKG